MQTYGVLQLLAAAFIAPNMGLGLSPSIAKEPSTIATSPSAHNAPVGPAVIGNPGTWVQTYDYPSSALRNEQEGVVGFRVKVSPSGIVSTCEIVTTSGFPVLDEATCRLVTMRARFTPAIDEKGNATEGSYSSRVRWKIPRGNPPPKAGSTIVSLIVEKDGSQTNCQIIRADPGIIGPPVGSTPCSPIKFEPPFTNDRGEPIRMRVTRTMSIALEAVKD